jgi:osmotically-inducible protein OsmY
MQHPVLISLFMALVLTTVSACTPTLSNHLIVDKKGQRTLGTMYNDQLIEITIKNHALNASLLLQDAHFNITSFNGIVLLTGQVPSGDTKNLVVSKARQVSNVREVHNEMTVSKPISLSDKTKDSLVTTKITARMMLENNFPVSRIKVITENSVVYLMGLVTSTEADWAVNLTRRNSGIQKIVKVFEYID